MGETAAFRIAEIAIVCTAMGAQPVLCDQAPVTPPNGGRYVGASVSVQSDTVRERYRDTLALDVRGFGDVYDWVTRTGCRNLLPDVP